jgi:hypothetical protein
VARGTYCVEMRFGVIKLTFYRDFFITLLKNYVGYYKMYNLIYILFKAVLILLFFRVMKFFLIKSK